MSTDDQKTSTPPQNGTPSHSSHLSNDSTPATNVKETQPSPTEVTSKTDDPQSSKPSSPADADPLMQGKMSSEHTSTSPTTKNDSIQTTRETGDAESGKHDSAAVANSHVPEIISGGKETTTKADGTGGQAPAEVTPQTNDPESLKPSSSADADPSMQGKISSEPTASSPATKNDSIQTTQKTGDADPGKQDSAAIADPDVPKVTPVEKTTSQGSDPTHNGHSENTADSRTTTEENAGVDAKSSKRSSWFRWLTGRFSGKGKRVPSKKSSVGPDNKSPTTSTDRDDIVDLIKGDLSYIDKRTKNLEQLKDKLKEAHEKASGSVETLHEKSMDHLKGFKYALLKLKLQIPEEKGDADYRGLQKLQALMAEQDIPNEWRDIMPQAHKNALFENSVEFKDFEDRYNKLSIKLKLCLLCFSIFPEDAIIKKRLMVQWWACEGFVDKKEADTYFNILVEKGFIEPVNKNKSPAVGECRMHPFYRSALAMLAERAKFFNFDDRGQPTQNFLGSCQACLVGDGVLSYDDLKSEFDKKVGLGKANLRQVLEGTLRRVHLLINVKEGKLDFKHDWFSMMKNVNFIHLGTWRTTDYVEVESTEFLEKVGNMDYLKFLSLQGVANVIKLPDSILEFANLEVLDLRGCHNLEAIPEKIGLLKSLKSLDMSDCSLLDHMPKSLRDLKELEVLKGFVNIIKERRRNQTCTLSDLSKLPKLEKLCIYTSSREFPNDEDVKNLGDFKELLKLTITWRGIEQQPAAEKSSESQRPTPERKGIEQQPAADKSSESQPATPKLPNSLRKLDLKCFPMRTTPHWLALRNLDHLSELKKLYIRGGKFSDLGQYQDADDRNLVWQGKEKKKWEKVTDLRLKFLSEIELEWTQLHELFPRLEYLEQVDCPKLTFFPCDANGVWINNSKRRRDGTPI